MAQPAPSHRRRPLLTLPLLHYAPDAPPSPVSLPLKRNAPPSDSNVSISPQKQRRLDPSHSTGNETVKKGDTKRIVTPKVKDILERDELGVGKSPARRLFSDASDHVGLGISGAVSTPKSPVASSSKQTLAPSPPISPCFVSDVDIHDCGFTVHSDQPVASVGIGTPDSRKNRLLEHTNSDPVPSSPTTQFDDKENVPPTPHSSLSANSTPSKDSAKSTPTCSTADEEEVTFLPTSSRRRTVEKSKLGLESILCQKDDLDDTDEEVEELTPGKTIPDRRKGKTRLSDEVSKR